MGDGVDVVLGELVPLKMQLFDGDDTKFVRATIKKPDGSNFVAPLNVPTVGSGLYKDSSVIMPSLSSLTATYEVFNDAAFLIPNVVHGNDVDTFNLSVPDVQILTLLNEIKVKVCDILDIISVPTRTVPIFEFVAITEVQSLLAKIEEVILLSQIEVNEVVAEIEPLTPQGVIEVNDLVAIMEVTEIAC